MSLKVFLCLLVFCCGAAGCLPGKGAGVQGQSSEGITLIMCQTHIFGKSSIIEDPTTNQELGSNNLHGFTQLQAGCMLSTTYPHLVLLHLQARLCQARWSQKAGAKNNTTKKELTCRDAQACTSRTNCKPTAQAERTAPARRLRKQQSQ